MFDSAQFPNLQAEGFTPRSPKTTRYNCIAWAAEDQKRWWSPFLGYYWPPGVARTTSLDSYLQAFNSVGFEVCADAAYEAGLKKIALYALNGVPKHAARQIDAVTWTSKMGRNIDIEHTLHGLEGPFYGYVVRFLAKPI